MFPSLDNRLEINESIVTAKKRKLNLRFFNYVIPRGYLELVFVFKILNGGTKYQL